MSAVLIENLKLTLGKGRSSRSRSGGWTNRPRNVRTVLKYSLFYGRPGERIVGYDNERGKGDHRHYRTREERYLFVSFEKLLTDFWNDVRTEIEND